MKTVGFWALDATVLFALSLVYLHQGYQRKNLFFAIWLCNGVAMQLIGAWALAAGPPPWIDRVRMGEDILTYALTAAILITAVLHRDCPVNRSLLYGVGAMVALNLFCRFMGAQVDHSAQIWLRNIAFFGPALFMLIALSNMPLDMLPLRINEVIRGAGTRWSGATAFATVSRGNRGAAPPMTRATHNLFAPTFQDSSRSSALQSLNAEAAHAPVQCSPNHVAGVRHVNDESHGRAEHCQQFRSGR